MQNFTAFGRVVWGHPGNMVDKKDNRKQVVLKDGQPVKQIAFGLAIAKLTTIQQQGGNPAHSFEQGVWPYLDAEAKTGFPNGVPPGFSWKWKDGDGVDREGKPYSAREGYAGHYVLTIASEFAVGLFRFNGQTYDQITPDQIKTGDYVAVSISCKLNIPTDRTHTPGLYINPQGVELVGFGNAIVSGPDAQTMFGGQQYALPPGASSTPQPAPNAPGMPGMPGQQPTQPQGGMPGQQPMQPQGGMPGQQPNGYPGQQQPGMPAPAHDFIPGQMPPR